MEHFLSPGIAAVRSLLALAPASSARTLYFALSAGLAVVFVLLLWLVIFNIKKARQEYLRGLFHQAYRIRINNDIILRKAKPSQTKKGGGYSLGQVSWEHANKDGSRDKRRASNGTTASWSAIALSDFAAVSREPVAIAWLVNALRTKGIAVSKSSSELELDRLQRNRLHATQHLNTCQEIYARFTGSDNPYGFEEYCAYLYQMQGYAAHVTPRSGDGGYDIEMTDPQGRTCLAECKCFDPSATVGRSLIQKLGGVKLQKRPERALYLTTASYTKEAKAYAREVGIELVDGIGIARMNESLSAHPIPSSPTGRTRSLSWEEVAQHYPPDCPPPSHYRQYFS